MLLGIALAYGLSWWRTDLFFPTMLLAIGGRYLTFATVYWMFGVTLAACGFLLSTSATHFATGAFAGGIIEMIFAAVVYMQLRSREAIVPVAG